MGMQSCFRPLKTFFFFAGIRIADGTKILKVDFTKFQQQQREPTQLSTNYLRIAKGKMFYWPPFQLQELASYSDDAWDSILRLLGPQ